MAVVLPRGHVTKDSSYMIFSTKIVGIHFQYREPTNRGVPKSAPSVHIFGAAKRMEIRRPDLAEAKNHTAPRPTPLDQCIFEASTPVRLKKYPSPPTRYQR